MNLVAITIPEEPERLADWLERQLVGPDLGALVAELSAVHGPPPAAPGLAGDLVGDRLAQVRACGLAALPPDALRRLLRQPAALFELQELVLSEASDYWDRLLSADATLDAPASRGEHRLSAFLDTWAPEGRREPALRPFPSRGRWYRRPVVVSLATAAALLLTVGAALWFAVDRFRPPHQVVPVATAWGWNRPEALAPEASDADYLRKLAREADDYFAEQPDEPAALARRILEFREGCTRLILADHPLQPATRDWLRERCNAWAEKIDGHLRSLEKANGRNTPQVRDDMAATVRQLQNALRAQADKLA